MEILNIVLLILVLLAMSAGAIANWLILIVLLGKSANGIDDLPHLIKFRGPGMPFGIHGFGGGDDRKEEEDKKDPSLSNPGQYA